MSTPIKDALALIATIDAGKPLDPAEVKAALWKLINELRRP